MCQGVAQDRQARGTILQRIGTHLDLHGACLAANGLCWPVSCILPAEADWIDGVFIDRKFIPRPIRLCDQHVNKVQTNKGEALRVLMFCVSRVL